MEALHVNVKLGGKHKVNTKCLTLYSKDLPNMPYKFRKSIYSEDDNVRDYIFIGYCIPYLIQKEQSRIVLLDIIKWRQT